MVFKYGRQGALGWITIENPPFNALPHPIFADRTELSGFLKEPDLKAVILRGQGSHFCSGADPDGFHELFSNCKKLAQALDKGKELIRLLSFAPVPVVALIQGSCFGGGLELALGCHFRFSSKNAMFGFPECDHGLMPGLGGTLYTRDLLVDRHRVELILSGKIIRAEEALQIGLVDHVGPSMQIEEKTVQFIDKLTSKHSPQIVHAIMHSIHNGRRLPVRQALLEETRLFCRLARETHFTGQ